MHEIAKQQCHFHGDIRLETSLLPVESSNVFILSGCSTYNMLCPISIKVVSQAVHVSYVPNVKTQQLVLASVLHKEQYHQPGATSQQNSTCVLSPNELWCSLLFESSHALQPVFSRQYLQEQPSSMKKHSTVVNILHCTGCTSRACKQD